MELYIISGLAILLFVFLVGICVQLIRIEKVITEMALLVEIRVNALLNPE